MRRPLLLALLLCGLLCQCQRWIDPEPLRVKAKLPAGTQEGRNTSGCHANGKLYLPKGGPLFSTHIRDGADTMGRQLKIRC